MATSLSELRMHERSDSGAILIDHIKPHATFNDYPKNAQLMQKSDGQMLAHLIIKGICGVHRATDDLLLLAMEGPFLSGVGDFSQQNAAIYINTITPCTIGALTQEKAIEIIEQKNLWKTLALYRGDVIRKLFISHSHLTAPTAYEIIRIQLLLLMNEPDEFRLSIPVEHYIRQKTGLSRSGTMKILSQLRQGEYICIENGILQAVNKLPERY